MAETLVIRFDAETEETVTWIAVDSDGTRVGAPGSGTLDEASQFATGRDVVVLVPAATVLTTTVDIPVKRGPRLLAALPFALEEQLADDVEHLHFAAGSRRENGQIPVAVVADAYMRAWLSRLDEADISPSRIIAENHGLARIPGTLSMLVAESQIMFNDGDDSEFVLKDVKPSDVLALGGILTDNDDQEASGHLLVFCEPEAEKQFEHDWIALRHELASVDLNLLPDGVLPRLAVTVASGHGINLLQGRYGIKAAVGELFKPWRFAAALLVTFGIVGIVTKGVDYYRLAQEESALKAQFTEIYREIRPQDTREILDPIATVDSLRRGTGGPAAAQVFLPSLQQLSLAIQQNSSATVEAISYRAGVIDVRLTAPDVATLDSIQKIVGTSGRFTASIQSTDQVGDRVSSRIQIREAGV